MGFPFSFRLEASSTGVKLTASSSEKTGGVSTDKLLSSNASSTGATSSDSGASSIAVKSSQVKEVNNCFLANNLFLQICSALVQFHPSFLALLSLYSFFSIFFYHLLIELPNFYLQVGPARGVIPLVDADIQTSGAKAASCAQLASLATSSTKGSLGSLQDNPLFISSVLVTILFLVAVAKMSILLNEPFI